MNINYKNYELPNGWAWIELKDLVEDPKKDIVDGPFGSNLKSNEFIDFGIPIFKIQNIKANKFLDKNINFISKNKAKELERHSFRSGDLIITKLGDPLGLCCKVPPKYKYGIIVADLIRVRPNKQRVFDKYLIYTINSEIVQNQFKAFTKGTTRPRVNLTIVRSIKLALPPVVEQGAIVERIEELFSELDNGIANIKKARRQLKVYRQAVLKKAFEGELTRKWREGQTGLPGAEDLLEKIKAERQERHGEQVARWQKAVKSWEELPPLPPNWSWIKLGNITEEPKYGTSKKCDYELKGKAVLRIPNIGDGLINDSDLKFAEFDEKEVKTYELKHGDLLTIRSNGSIDLVGKCALITKKEEKYLFAGYLIRLRPLKNLINSKYLLNSLTSIFLRNQIESKAKSTSGVNNINSDELRGLIIPMCSYEEQGRVVGEIERRLSVCDNVEAGLEEVLQKAEALRQSILKKAFEGKLLNDRELAEIRRSPDWEPAEKLLARIQAEQKNQKKGPNHD